MKKNEKFICSSIIILEIAALFVFICLKKNYSYNGYTFHLTDVDVYEISTGDSFIGEEIIRARDGSIEFRGKKYRIFLSGHKDTNDFDLSMHESTEDIENTEGDEKIATVSSEADKELELSIVQNFVLAVLAQNSPVNIYVIVILNVIGWIFLAKPDILFELFCAWKYKEELHPSNFMLHLTRWTAYALYAGGIWFTVKYLFF